MIDLPQYRDLHDLQCFLFSLFFFAFYVSVYDDWIFGHICVHRGWMGGGIIGSFELNLFLHILNGWKYIYWGS